MHSWKNKQKWLAIVILSTIVLLGAMFRLDNLNTRTIGHIEIYVPGIELPYELSQPRPRLSLWKTLTGTVHDVHPPAWYFLMWFWTKLFGSDLFIIRLPSVLFGVGALLLIYVLAKIQEDRLTALLAAGFLAFNGFHILWSQIARMYITASFLGLLSTILLLLILRGGPRQRLFLWFYLVITLIGLGTSYYFWPIFATHIFWVFLNSLSKKSLPLGLFRSQLLILILASPLITLAAVQSGVGWAGQTSFLSYDSLKYLIEFLQFGFLFEPDRDALIQNPLPTLIRFSLPLLASLFLIIGLIPKKSGMPASASTDVAGPSLIQHTLATVFALICVIVSAKIFSSQFPHKMNMMLSTSAIPLVIFLLGLLFQRNSVFPRKLRDFLNSIRPLSQEPYSVNSLLAVLPIIIIAGVSLFAPLLASRGLLLYTPYLLIVLSKGIRSIPFNKGRIPFILFLGVILFLIGIHFSSVVYNKSRPFSPTDYRRLAEKWSPHIKESDLVFVQRHWVTTPIFYYIKRDRCRFVGQNYLQQVHNNPDSRVWVLSFKGLPLPAELKNALLGYEPLTKIEALRIKAELYSRRK
jgi:4-amino-4-deoxy-L-arabinose transferase-like glycosyltransferase